MKTYARTKKHISTNAGSKQKSDNKSLIRYQYAEMLKLSHGFIREHERVLRKLGKKFFKELKKSSALRIDKIRAIHELSKKPGNGISGRVRTLLSDPFAIWEHFCERWLVDPYTWNGKIDLLSAKNIYPYLFMDWDHAAIRLYITRFTSLEDIKRIWPEIEEKQKHVLYSPAPKVNFRRNLEWYTAIKIKNESYRRLFDFTVKNRKSTIEQIVMSRFRKNKSWNIALYTDKEMIEAIKKNRTKKNILKSFQEEIEDYTKTKYSSFRSMVKRSLMRLEERIGLIRPADLTMSTNGISFTVPGDN